ncbi:MAG: hypothetical protein HKN47_00670 [Pirellulaceae bacterium]|nr:hypothetical protein [Pirellulaceae bacterium]
MIDQSIPQTRTAIQTRTGIVPCCLIATMVVAVIAVDPQTADAQNTGAPITSAQVTGALAPGPQRYYDQPSYHQQQYAQQPYGTPPQPKPSTLQRLDKFGQSVKRRINRAFGVQSAEDFAPSAHQRQQYQGPPAQVPYQQFEQSAPYRQPITDANYGSPRETLRAAAPQRVQLQQYATEPLDSLRSPPQAVDYPDPGLGPDYPTDPPPMEMRRPIPVLPAPSRSVSSRMTTHSSPLGDAAGGPLDGPVIGGTRLGSAQVTATEHALRLQDENARLKSSRDTLTVENRRLTEQLRSAQNLLQRMQQAMGDANGELETLANENRTLQQKITDLETEQKRQLYDADRMLQSIRQELDDVLMREISFNNR